jgi:hypothetical protein
MDYFYPGVSFQSIQGKICFSVILSFLHGLFLPWSKFSEYPG